VTSSAFQAGNANEFPRINPQRVAASYRYAYIANNPPGQASGLQQRVTRVDMESGETVSHDFGPDGYVGEPVFVPARGGREEDDGYVIALVFDAASQRTRIVGLDARGLSGKPLFVAGLKHHVPFSLHGISPPSRSRLDPIICGADIFESSSLTLPLRSSFVSHLRNRLRIAA
jgi:all-trans-8'-apo-beta-carotenal 15,15'-oxygenase